MHIISDALVTHSHAQQNFNLTSNPSMNPIDSNVNDVNFHVCSKKIVERKALIPYCCFVQKFELIGKQANYLCQGHVPTSVKLSVYSCYRTSVWGGPLKCCYT